MQLDETWVGLDRVGARSRSVCGKEEYSITIMMFVHSNIILHIHANIHIFHSISAK